MKLPEVLLVCLRNNTNQMIKHITIKELARQLNVSTSTISKAFNSKYHDIRPETRKLIIEKAKELGYKPNPIARKLLEKRSYNLGVILPEFSSHFFTPVINGIQEQAISAGYQVLIVQSNESSEEELKNLQYMDDNMMDGVIISLSTGTTNIDYINEMIQKGMPFVVFNRVNDQVKAPSILFDDYKYSLFATEHLIYEGFNKILHFKTNYNYSSTQKRLQGFKRALEKNHLPFDQNQVIDVGKTIEDGFSTTEGLLREGVDFDSIYCSSDLTAIGAIKALKSHGKRIPEDFGIVGFAEGPMVEVIEPNLTSVSQSTHEMGQMAAKKLIELIEHPEDANIEDYVISGKLTKRESSVRASSSRVVHSL